MNWREYSKLKQIVEGLRKAIADDGRIHTTYMQTVAATGRLSSTDPNLQNIPVRTEQGQRIRNVFVVGSDEEGPFETLMTADYSQIEMRIMAHLSGDEALIEAFRAGRTCTVSWARACSTWRPKRSPPRCARRSRP